MADDRLPRWTWVVLLVHVILLAYIAWAHSPVDNESEYLAAGVCHWKTGVLEPACRNPPLPRLVGALPVLAMPHVFRPEFAVRDTDWHSGMFMSQQFLEENADRLRTLFFAGRLACIPFSILGAVVCYYWARELFGAAAGAVALLLWCFSPNVLANNALVMPDGIATSLGVWTAYRFRHWLREPNWPNGLLAGVALGWTLLAKATWIGLLILMPLVWLITRSYSGRRGGLKPFLTELAQLIVLYVTALFLINATYGFDGTFQRLGSYKFSSVAFGGRPESEDEEGKPPPPRELGNRFAAWHLGWVPVPLPRLYVLGIDIQRTNAERKRDNYLFGRWNTKGWWYYYFAAALVKMPLGTWGLLLGAFGAAVVSQRYRLPWREEVWLLAPALAMLLLLISQSSISRHFRYVLPLAPFLFVGISRLAQLPAVDRAAAVASLRMGLVVALVTATLVSSLAIYPHSMSYFNEAIGGPNQGHKYLLGSNIDRNQDRYYLERWQRSHPLRPEFVNIPTPGKPPKILRGSDGFLYAGWYAVSIDNLMDPKSQYYGLKDLPPVARVAYSTWIFYLEHSLQIRPDMPGDEQP
ncbi:MAG: hypothetical protein KatS3mg110_3756 [Pirellulaceae bacterium]|nr:MAG: hypothetical protein KatS3mg110_3756 [Pirellulaceae bacterium]